jgi:two-component system cell cycle sensor histidine kinase/response regulator CckA
MAHIAEKTRRETILVAEDDAGVRALVVQVLRDAGYDVIDSTTAEEAQRVVRDPTRTIDLLITDVLMPGVSGPDLAQELSTHHGQAKVLYVSGFTGSHLVEHKLTGSQRFLAKPFTVEQLLANVRAAIES